MFGLFSKKAPKRGEYALYLANEGLPYLDVFYELLPQYDKVTMEDVRHISPERAGFHGEFWNACGFLCVIRTFPTLHESLYLDKSINYQLSDVVLGVEAYSNAVKVAFNLVEDGSPRKIRLREPAELEMLYDKLPPIFDEYLKNNHSAALFRSPALERWLSVEGNRQDICMQVSHAAKDVSAHYRHQ